VSGVRILGFVLGAAVVASAAIASLVACKNGDYDGSYDGSFDGGTAAAGTTSSTVLKPDALETARSADGVFVVTFGPGTFAGPTTITITSAGEKTLETGLVVPLYTVAADKAPAKFFQVSFFGSGNANGGSGVLAPALQGAGGDTPLAVAGAPTSMTGSSSYWGLTRTLGTFTLAYLKDVQTATFAETKTSCTGQCLKPLNNAQVSGSPSGCFAASEANLTCFLEHCADLEAPAARCAALAAASSAPGIDCKPFAGSCSTGPGCSGFTGICGGTTGGGTNNFSACCVTSSNRNCSPMACDGFAARCTTDAACPSGTQCCVFESESYCAKDCPAAQHACTKDAECTDAGADAGADGGACQGGKCPVGVCGTLPVACR
jgi:hypothetical protein